MALSQYRQIFQAGIEICYEWQHLISQELECKLFKMKGFVCLLPSALWRVRLRSRKSLLLLNLDVCCFKYAYFWKMLPWWFSLLNLCDLVMSASVSLKCTSAVFLDVSWWHAWCFLLYIFLYFFYICVLCSLCYRYFQNKCIFNQSARIIYRVLPTAPAGSPAASYKPGLPGRLHCVFDWHFTRRVFFKKWEPLLSPQR